jgi:hypothetical protein
MLERSAGADLFKHTVSKIPTVFGRLAYLASLRDANSGIYRHHGLVATFGREESRKALRESHEGVFQEWLGLSLSEKKADLADYLKDLEDPRDMVLQHWTQSRIYRSYVPAVARESDKVLFSEELEILLEIFNYGAGGARPGQGPARPA